MPISIVVRDNTRCIGKRHTDLWTQARRQRYLIDQSAQVPISVDEQVTPIPDERDSQEDLVRIIAAAEFLADEPHGLNNDTNLTAWRNFARAHGTPTPTSTQWLPLGYDVCDETFLSGLMNCAIDRAHFGRNAGTMALSVNQHHLFNRIRDAERFRVLLCSAVPEHAPFFVVRLFAAS